MRFIRFVVAAPDPSSQVRQGVFQAAAELRDEAGLSEAEQQLLRDALAWFARNLPEPRRFSRKRNSYHRDQRGIAWFKDVASEHLRRIRELVAILEEHGRRVSMLESERPGYVVYEDAYQVVAEPFAETETWVASQRVLSGGSMGCPAAPLPAGLLVTRYSWRACAGPVSGFC